MSDLGAKRPMVDPRHLGWRRRGTRIFRSGVAGTVCLLLAVLPIAGRAASDRVETGSGPVRGTRIGDVIVFRGLPFAAPPIGALRWREPQAVERWVAERPATEAGAACPQKRGLSLEGGGDPGRLDEDCLFVDVFTPQAEASAPRPVMVWLHGGALIFGSGGLSIYDGAALARRGVVVTVNYRLGPLGFFAHPALERARPGGPVNFGLLDQVRQNVAAFGGDPNNVTVFGQSAGAESVLALMASPLASGLFARAIAQSPYGVPSVTRTKALAVGSAVAAAAGLPGERATLRALRRVPAERLATLEGKGLSLAPAFVVGDAAVPRPLLQAFRQGREAAVSLMIGSNSDDASVALAFGIKPAALVAQLGRTKGLVQRLYPDIVDDDAELGRQVARDAVFTAFVRRIAYLHAKRAPTFRYYFAYGRASGAGHGAEVPFVLGTTDACRCLPAPVSATDRAVERRVGDRWVAFATTGTPAGDVAWPTDDRRRGTVLEIADVDTARPAFMAARVDAVITALNIAGAIGSRSARRSTDRPMP